MGKTESMAGSAPLLVETTDLTAMARYALDCYRTDMENLEIENKDKTMIKIDGKLWPARKHPLPFLVRVILEFIDSLY